MKRRVLIILLAMLAISLVAIPAFGAEPIKINLNGYKLSSDVDPVVIKGRTVVPARVIAESLGADVQWDSSKQTATIIKNDTKITVKVNATLAEKNGETIALDSPAILKEGKLMLPLRFFAENFGADVGWDGKTREVKVNLAETKDGMSPEQYLIACNEAMSKITTAKINTSIQMNIGSSEAGRSLNMNADFQGCIRSPQECYIIGKIKMPPEIQEKDMQIEVYTDGQKACVRLDGGEWEEQTIPQTPETLKPLSGTGSDPSEILKQIKTMGLVLGFANDVVNAGQDYTVINVKLDMDKLRSIMDQAIQQSMDSVMSQSEIQDPQAMEMAKTMLKDMKMDFGFQLMINKKTKLMDIAKIKGNFSLDVLDFQLDVNLLGNVTMYDYNQPVEMPTINGAKI